MALVAEHPAADGAQPGAHARAGGGGEDDPRAAGAAVRAAGGEEEDAAAPQEQPADAHQAERYAVRRRLSYCS